MVVFSGRGHAEYSVVSRALQIMLGVEIGMTAILVILLFFLSREAMRKVKERQKYVFFVGGPHLRFLPALSVQFQSGKCWIRWTWRIWKWRIQLKKTKAGRCRHLARKTGTDFCMLLMQTADKVVRLRTLLEDRESAALFLPSWTRRTDDPSAWMCLIARWRQTTAR